MERPTYQQDRLPHIENNPLPTTEPLYQSPYPRPQIAESATRTVPPTGNLRYFFYKLSMAPQVLGWHRTIALIICGTATIAFIGAAIGLCASGIFSPIGVALIIGSSLILMLRCAFGCGELISEVFTARDPIANQRQLVTSTEPVAPFISWSGLPLNEEYQPDNIKTCPISLRDYDPTRELEEDKRIKQPVLVPVGTCYDVYEHKDIARWIHHRGSNPTNRQPLSYHDLQRLPN